MYSTDSESLVATWRQQCPPVFSLLYALPVFRISTNIEKFVVGFSVSNKRNELTHLEKTNSMYHCTAEGDCPRQIEREVCNVATLRKSLVRHNIWMRETQRSNEYSRVVHE